MTQTPPTPEQPKEAALKARNRRNWVLAAVLFAFVIIVFVVTLVHLGGNVANRTF